MIRYFLQPLLLSFTLSFMPMRAEFLSLPQKFSHKAVFHIKAHQLNDFCCGYNALYNACNFEKLCELHQPFSEYAQFKKLCMNYAMPLNIDPKDAVSNATLDILASDEFLNMQQVCNVHFNDMNQIVPFLTRDVVVTHDSRMSEREVKRLMRQERARCEQEEFRKIKNKLDSSTRRCEIVHFICFIDVVKETGHAVLISLLHNKFGRALYIFDNVNAKIDERSETKLFIDFLCNTFAISSRTTFKGPRIPEAWQTTPKRSVAFHDEYYASYDWDN